MTYIVTEWQRTNGHEWERLEGTSTAVEFLAEFGIDPTQGHIFTQTIPFVGERIVTWRLA